MQCVENNRRFGGTCGLHPWSRGTFRTRNQRDVSSKQRHLTFGGLHGTMPQKKQLFLITAVSVNQPYKNIPVHAHKT
jgi:hypothetical protein